MATLLFIESSPRDGKSASTAIARAFVDAWREKHAGGTVDTLDVWDGTLPEFDGASLQAKYAALAGQDPTPEQKAAWSKIEAYAKRFHDADVVVFAIPLWNYTIPYKLKQLIDVVSQNGLLFDFHDDGSVSGKLGGKKTVVAYARGSFYDAGSPTPSAEYDQAKPFMATWFRVIGLDDVAEIAVEKTLMMKPDDLASAIDAKRREARELAARF